MKQDELYLDINNHLLKDEKPSIYLNTLISNPEFKQYPFNMLFKLNETEQSPIHHPEGNVWNHTMLVVDQAAKIKNRSKHPNALMWSALLHDIGKPSTTKVRKGKITSYDHDKVGEKLSIDFLSVFTDDKDYINRISKLIRYHMQILFVVKSLPFKDIKGMKLNTDIEEIALLGFCDRMGRTNSNSETEKDNIEKFLNKCKSFG